MTPDSENIIRSKAIWLYCMIVLTGKINRTKIKSWKLAGLRIMVISKTEPFEFSIWEGWEGSCSWSNFMRKGQHKQDMLGMFTHGSTHFHPESSFSDLVATQWGTHNDRSCVVPFHLFEVTPLSPSVSAGHSSDHFPQRNWIIYKIQLC